MKIYFKNPKIGIFIIAYQASQTLISAYKRIPSSLKRKAKEIYCFDDCSDDNTYYAGLGYKMANKVKKFTLYKNPKNLGYGGNQKKGYTYAIKKGFDLVVMLHGDAQYAPEKMPLLLQPFSKKDPQQIGMVMGSRMLGKPLSGGMPFYKYLGNKTLTTIENLLLGTNLSEFHSGYRVFNIHALKNIPYKRCSNGFHFDTEIIILLLNAGYKIIEVPIPTYYGPGSKSHVNVFTYGINCLSSVVKYRLTQLGFKKHSFLYTENFSPYQLKKSKYSSHLKIASSIRILKMKKVLDIGCGQGNLAQALGNDWLGELFGIDKNKFLHQNYHIQAYKKLYIMDLNKGDFLEKIKEKNFDLLVFADILEHLQTPEKNLVQMKKVLRHNGYIIVSLPNLDFVPVRLIHTLFPSFCMKRGPFDKTHKHFFTIEQAKKLVEQSSFKIKEIQSTSALLSVLSLIPSVNENQLLYKIIARVELLMIKIMPRYFSYQFIIIAQKLN
jgi:2-polyprenyl-3-methyl-5-hydroxy-6-metoxy-1,4-benzoquinol methylase